MFGSKQQREAKTIGLCLFGVFLFVVGCIMLRLDCPRSFRTPGSSLHSGGDYVPTEMLKEQSFFRYQWTARIANELRYYQSGISRRGVWNTASIAAPWSFVLHISAKRELWIPPQPALLPKDFQTTYMSYTLGSLTVLQLLLKEADFIPDVTVVFHFTDNCIYYTTDSRLLQRASEIQQDRPVHPSWKPWLSDDNTLFEQSILEPMNMHMAPGFFYQSTVWTPTSLECRGVTFPQYDWVWPRQDFTEGSQDRKDGISMMPWEQRKPMLVFRGTQKADSIPYFNNSDTSIRYRAALVGLKYPDLIDAKLTDHRCKHPDPPNCKHPTFNPDAFDSSPERSLSFEAQLAYKYQLDLDGHGGSFRFKHLLLTGSLVFKVDSPLNQFWMPQLMPWVHYIPVSWHDLDRDLVAKLIWAKNNDAKAKKIMLAGREFANRHMTDASVTWYMQQVLRQVSKLQTPSFPMVQGSVRFCCSMVPDKFKAEWQKKCDRLEQQNCSTASLVDLEQFLFNMDN